MAISFYWESDGTGLAKAERQLPEASFMGWQIFVRLWLVALKPDGSVAAWGSSFSFWVLTARIGSWVNAI